MTQRPLSSGGFLNSRRAMLLGTTILSLGAAALFVAPDAARHAQYEAIYARFLDLEARVEPLYDSIPCPAQGPRGIDRGRTR